MGYARQDRQFLSGEVVTMSIVAKMLEVAGAKKVVVVDIHSKTALNHFKISKVKCLCHTRACQIFQKIETEKCVGCLT